jgi:tetratricopeptide (TPR) repeat protein
LLYLILFTVAFWKFRKKSFLSFAILWYILAILFYSNVLFPVAGIVGERFVFNASLGFCMAFIGVVFLIFKTDPKSLTIEIDVRLKILASVILVIIPYATLTLARNNEWRSLNNLYAGDIKFLDRSVKANIDLGNFYLAQTDTTKAIRYLEKAIAIWPDSSRCMQLRALYIQKGEEQKAAYFRRLSEQLHLQQQ